MRGLVILGTVENRSRGKAGLGHSKVHAQYNHKEALVGIGETKVQKDLNQVCWSHPETVLHKGNGLNCTCC